MERHERLSMIMGFVQVEVHLWYCFYYFLTLNSSTRCKCYLLVYCLNFPIFFELMLVVLRDAAHECFPILSFSDEPASRYGLFAVSLEPDALYYQCAFCLIMLEPKWLRLLECSRASSKITCCCFDNAFALLYITSRDDSGSVDALGSASNEIGQ